MGVIFKNNVMYNGGDTLIQPTIYSEEEREIGCWTDGKPLYQKTIPFTIASHGETVTIESNMTYIDKLVSMEGILGNRTNIPQGSRGNVSGQIWLSFSNEILQALVGSNTDSITGQCYVTIRYTKTSDTPGSGIWTPQGTYAEHYSENEHVIGTWIDGSTLYEKTLYYSSISASKTDWTQLIQFDEADMLLSYNTRATWNNRQLDNAYLRISLYNGYLYHHEGELANGSTLSNYCATIRYTKSTSSS